MVTLGLSHTTYAVPLFTLGWWVAYSLYNEVNDASHIFADNAFNNLVLVEQTSRADCQYWRC